MEVGKVRLPASRRLVDEALVLSRTQLARDDGGRDHRRTPDARPDDLGEGDDRGRVILERARGPATANVLIGRRACVREHLQLTPDQLREGRIARRHGLIDLA